MGLIASSFSTGASGTGSGVTAANTSNAISNTNSMMQAASVVGQNYPTQVKLPDWLTTNPDDLQQELLSQYKTGPKSITDAADTAAGVANKGADQAYDQSLRQGGNAVRQMTNVARQQGGTGATSSIVAGQMASDAAKQKTDSKVQIAQMQLQAKTQAAGLSTQIAQALGGLRSSYLGTLAGVNNTLRGQDMGLTQTTASIIANQASQDATAQAAAKAADAASAAKAPTSSMSYSGMMGAGMGSYTGVNGSSGPNLQTLYSGVGHF